MNDDLKFLLAISCVVPAVAGILIFRNINKRFYPFVYILLLALLTELLQRSFIVLKVDIGSSNLISNVFILLNLPLHVLFFYNVKVIKSVKNALYYLSFFGVVYIINVINVASPFAVYQMAIIISYIIILKLCIDGIVLQTFDGQRKWMKDSLFIFCSINVLYSSYLIFAFSLRFFGIPADTKINVAVSSMYNYINAACYLLTLWAVLCIPRKNYIELYF